MKNDSLDEFMRGKLDKLNQSREHNAWDKYQDYKDTRDSIDEDFDAFMKDNLDNQNIEAVPNWSAFSADLVQIENEDFDEYVKESMEHEEGPYYTEGAWTKYTLFHKERIAKNVHLIATRVLEVAAIFLIIWSILPFASTYFDKIKTSQDNESNQFAIDIPSDENQLSEVVKSDMFSGRSQSIDNEITDISGSLTIKSQESENHVNTRNMGNNTTQNSSGNMARMNIGWNSNGNASNNTEIVTTRLRNNPVKRNEKGRFAIAAEIYDIAIKQLPQHWDSKDINYVTSVYDNQEELSSLLSLNNIIDKQDKDYLNYMDQRIKSLDMLDTKEISFLDKALIAAEISQGSANSSPLSIAVHLSGRKDIITSPIDEVYDIDARKSTSNGIGFGIDLQQKVGKKTSVSTGLAYDFSSYRTPYVVEWYQGIPGEYKGISLEEIELSKVSIPVELNYDLVQLDKLSLYGNLGASYNLITNTQYFIYNYDSGTEKKLGIQNIDINSTDHLQTQLFKKEFADGYFQGGSFKDNSYATVHAGLGISHKSSDHFSVFIEGDYHRNIFRKSFGPNNDVIDQLNFTAGVKYSL